MAAPTPVSAYLHSATMVKAGVFLLARLYPVLGGSALFEYVVVTVGLVTMVFGAYVAIFKHDLKGLLAYSTISHLGLITFLIGLDSPLSAVAAVFHILNHATFKAALFMTAGIIDHETRHARHAPHQRAVAATCRTPRPWRWSRPPPWPACRCSTASSPRRCSSTSRLTCATSACWAAVRVVSR